MNKSSLKTDLLLIFLLLLLSVLYGYHKILPHGPYSLHEWRQADCLAFALNYYKENLNFFTPAFQWVGEGNGKTISEFPIIYYTVGQLWKVFGQHEYIFRLIDMIIVYTGLFFLYKLVKQYLLNTFWAIISVLFLFTSPILVFYSNNFLADAPAFGFVLIACYHLWKYYSTMIMRSLYFACFFFLLGGLLKISALLIFMGILPLHIFNVFLNKKQKFSKYSLLPFALVLLLILAWNVYIHYYNTVNLGYSLQGILPIWELTFSQRRDISIELFNTIMPSYHSVAAVFMLFFMFMFSVLNWRRANRFLVALNVICLFGSIMFLILFYQVFNVHDYYLVNLLIMIPLTILTFLDLVKRINPSWLDNKKLKTLAIIGIVMLVYNTTAKTRLKYDYDDYFVSRTFVIDKATKDYYGWYNWNYKNTSKALETIQPYLRQLGIQRTDKVISLPDQSANMTLYLMDLKGFTDFGLEGDKPEASLRRCIAKGAKYLIINDKRVYERTYLEPYLHHKIGSYKTVDIYSLTDLPKSPVGNTLIMPNPEKQ